jgi:hypothetical protein
MIVALLGLACAQEASSGVQEPLRAAPAAAQAKMVALETTWPEVATLDRAVLARLSEANRQAVAMSHVPVLLASEPELVQNAIVMAKPAFTAIATRGDGITIALHAHRFAHHYPDIPPAQGNRSVRGHKAFVTQNEAIWSASWIENGTAYDLSVECGALLDPRCDDEAYLLEVAGSLRYVGGRAHAKEVLP